MSVRWKPQQYSSVSVYLMAERAQRVVDFLKQVFDATELRRLDLPDGPSATARYVSTTRS